MERFEFDDAYVRRLREGDRDTAEHFVSYFHELLGQMLRRRVPPDAVDDLRQEVLARVWQRLAELREGGALGKFVRTVAHNVVLEYYRKEAHHSRPEGLPDPIYQMSADEELVTEENCRAVRHTLATMKPRRDADILRALFMDEIPKEDVCRRYGVDMNYLRVLVHRAKESFRKQFKG